MNRQEIEKYFEFLSNPDPSCDGLERLFSSNGVDEVFLRLQDHEKLDLNKVQLNQLLILAGLTSISFGFFKYYWLDIQSEHPYNLNQLQLCALDDNKNGEENISIISGFENDDIESIFTEVDESGNRFTKNSIILNISHLRWGLLRIYTDSLLYFGNITLGFNELNKKKENELVNFFKSKKFDITLIKERGHCIDFNEIERNDRYLISEAVCKNLDADNVSKTALREKLITRYNDACTIGLKNVKVGVLLDKDANLKKYKDIPDIAAAKKNKDIELTMEDDISTTEFIETIITSEEDIDKIVTPLYERFLNARSAALQNTKLYLSLLNDMDVYVATSMRSKDDFLKMANNCYDIFHEPKIKKLNLRYFDPTISAAEGHDDKGLIECLMVQCAKILIYSSGDKDSYGKDAEAAMALSSGKPVIFYCPDDIRYNVSKNIHPLTKLIDFNTGVANGAMIAKNLPEVCECLNRLLNNNMQYAFCCEKVAIEENGQKIEKSYYKLKELLTSSNVRVQTSDLFLSNSFWNYFSRNFPNKNLISK